MDCQPGSIRGRRWRRKSLAKTENCGDDEEEEERKKQKSLLHVRMCTSLLFLCTIWFLCCFFSPVCGYVLLCGIYFYVLCLGFVSVHSISFIFLSCSICVYHTWVKQPSPTLSTAFFYPTQVQENCSLSFGLTQTAPELNESQMTWPDTANKPCLCGMKSGMKTKS